MAYTSACSARAAPPLVPHTGGTPMSIWARPFSCRLIGIIGWVAGQQRREVLGGNCQLPQGRGVHSLRGHCTRHRLPPDSLPQFSLHRTQETARGDEQGALPTGMGASAGQHSLYGPPVAGAGLGAIPFREGHGGAST
ncbi:unnamed protein product [Sphagnum balticum]